MWKYHTYDVYHIFILPPHYQEGAGCCPLSKKHILCCKHLERVFKTSYDTYDYTGIIKRRVGASPYPTSTSCPESINYMYSYIRVYDDHDKVIWSSLWGGVSSNLYPHLFKYLQSPRMTKGSLIAASSFGNLRFMTYSYSVSVFPSQNTYKKTSWYRWRGPAF